MQQKLVLLLPWVTFADVHLKKDTGLFPLYMAKVYGIPAEIVFTDSPESTTAESIEGVVKISRFTNTHHFQEPPTLRHPIQWLQFMKPYTDFIKKNKHTVSHYMFFHASEKSLLLSFFAKKCNKTVKTYIKLDANQKAVQGLAADFSKACTGKKRLRQKMLLPLFKKLSLLSVETRSTLSVLQSAAVPFTNNLALVPNGIVCSAKISTVPKKEKILCTVCRLGAQQKNMALFLRALSHVIDVIESEGWRIYFVGSTQTDDFDFEGALNDFFCTYPQAKALISVTGAITRADTLQELYQKSSVFVLPSTNESFAIAALEAGFWGNYLILSDFCSAPDFITSPQFGYILPESAEGAQNEEVMEAALSVKIKEVVQSPLAEDAVVQSRMAYFRSHFSMENIIRSAPIKQFCT